MPFDFQDVIQDDAAREDDALEPYAALYRLLEKRMLSDAQGIDIEIYWKPNHEWDPTEVKSFVANRDLLSDYQQFGEMERTSGRILRDANSVTFMPASVTAMSQLVRFGEFQAALFERDGDLERVWASHRVGLQSGIHCEAGGAIPEVLVRVALRGLALSGTVRRAGDRSLSPEQLRNSRYECVDEYTKRLPLFHVLKVEYLIDNDDLRQFGIPPSRVHDLMAIDPIQGPLREVSRFAAWSLGQPENSQRLSRQLLVNNAREIDRQRHLRQKAEMTGKQIVFEVNPQSHMNRGEFNFRQLTQAIDDYLSRVEWRDWSVPRSALIDQVRRSEDSEYGAFLIVMALREFHRIHGEFPKSSEQLVPQFLDEIPIDFTSSNNAPIQYGRQENEDAVVWYCGLDGIDNGGNIDGNNRDDRGYRIRVRRQD